MTSNRADIAFAAAEAGGEVAAASFRRDLTVETKANATDVVTQADRDAQQKVIATIREAYPKEPIIAEEAGEPKCLPDEGPAWVVDPIDGTTNFVVGTRSWVTSVAAVRDGDPVAAANVAPALGDIYTVTDGKLTRAGDSVSVSDEARPEAFTVAPTIWWPRNRRTEYARACREIVERFGDLRRIGSAQLALSMVAAGELEGAFTNVAANPWDTVAGAHLVRQGDGRVTNLQGERWQHDDRGFVASNGERHGDLLAAARGVDESREQ